MPSNPPSVESVFGALAKIPQPPPKRFTDKLASVTVGTPEAFYLLATYCFDLSRKLLYLSKIAGPYVANIPPDLAQEIEADTDAINENGLSWEDRAELAEDIMLRLYREVDSGVSS
jgi:hypothetical protein